MALTRKKRKKPATRPDSGPKDSSKTNIETSAEATDADKAAEEESAIALMKASIVMSAGSYLLRKLIERKVLVGNFDPEKAKETLSERRASQSLASFAAAKIATKSDMGAILVGGGILAKGLFDRGQNRRDKQRLAAANSDTKSNTDSNNAKPSKAKTNKRR